MTRHSRGMRCTALGCIALVAGVLLPGSAAADPTPVPSILQAGRRAVVLQAAEAPKAAAMQSGQSPADRSVLESKSFFKTKTGAAVLVFFGAGVGYAVYSSSNDRIRGAGR